MKTDAVAAAVSEALRLVNRSSAGWPEEAVEHAAKRAAELAREECAMDDHVDANVAAVVERLSLREKAGLLKYGVTTERDDIDTEGWLLHLQAELLDGAIYAQRLIAAIRAGSGE